MSDYNENENLDENEDLVGDNNEEFLEDINDISDSESNDEVLQNKSLQQETLNTPKKETSKSNDFVKVRILNGNLKGCEFYLDEQNDTEFVVQREELFNSLDSKLKIPDEAIFIPMPSGGLNFNIKPFKGGSNIEIELKTGEDLSTKSYQLDSIIKIGSLYIACSLSKWTSEILDFVEPKEAQDNSINLKDYLLPIFGFSFVLVLGFVIYTFYESSDEEIEIDLDEKEELVTIIESNDNIGYGHEYEEIQGRDGFRYVFADTEVESRRIKQTLLKLGQIENVKVLTYKSQIDKLKMHLKKYWPHVKYHSISFKSYQELYLAVSQERFKLSSIETQDFEKEIKRFFPYIYLIKIEKMSDNKVIEAVLSSILSLGITYDVSQTNDEVRFLFKGNLKDDELIRIRALIHDFYTTYEDNYVKFAIELETIQESQEDENSSDTWIFN